MGDGGFPVALWPSMSYDEIPATLLPEKDWYFTLMGSLVALIQKVFPIP